MRAAIIIPVHNRKDVTLRCLRSLHDSRLPADFGIIMVDDGSTDGTAAAVATDFPDVVIEHGNGELFWTGGIVQGMRRALAEGAAFLFWLNDDCIPEADALPRMLAYLEGNPRAICGASCFVRGGAQPVETGFRQRRAWNAIGGATEVDGLSGYCVGMPATVCAELGLPDARHLPHYGADSIYTLNAKRKGYRVILLKEVRVNLLDGKPVQTVEDRARSSTLSWSAFIRTAFFARKSPFFLKGQYWYHRYKYGFLLGGLLFLVKCFRWAWTMAFYWRRRSWLSVPDTH
jgi:GT2 family glycosyltransferase